MKVRIGFVSNSSSSSFVIPLKDIPSSVEDLQQMMYGDASEVEYMYNWDNEDTRLDTRVLAEIVYKDITGAAELSAEEVFDMADEGWSGSDVCDEIRDITKKYRDAKVIVLTYGDGDGKYFTQLEHSGIIESTFKGSVRVSQH